MVVEKEKPGKREKRENHGRRSAVPDRVYLI